MSDDCLSSIKYRVVAEDAIGQFLETYAVSGCLVAIDIPIGLSDSRPRACDLAARKFLKPPRSSSVFPTPCRGALAARSFPEACELNFAACGRKTTLQTYHILPKIRAVDRAVTPELQARVRESHPEVVFACLSGEGRGLPHNKLKRAGRYDRLALLERRLETNIDVGSIRDVFGRSRLPVADLLDALACLVAASDLVRGTAAMFPDDRVEQDARGLRMEIVA